jgi:hypothetical protein
VGALYLCRISNKEDDFSDLIQELDTNSALISFVSKLTEFHRNNVFEKFFRFPLICPITKTRMRIPVRSIKCNKSHPESFDFISFTRL